MHEMPRRAFAIAALGLVAGAAPVRAADQCAISAAKIDAAGSYVAAVTAAVRTEFSCEGAYRVLELCQLGSSGDNALSDIVIAKCEPRFLPKASPAIRAAYGKARAKCSKIAAKDGTMYQGQAAVCVARAGRDFARKYGTKS
ncbi:hypothetical protein [Rhodopseudomonas boonkerdii]|uniref:hypothetical protein n=1 Tax=Rhodopseudomonas boonkerdii TaxID=475937 RepID=UPI001E4617AD|nr:hypothetical protein [Rhodopseudomonas boonkerdii]